MTKPASLSGEVLVAGRKGASLSGEVLVAGRKGASLSGEAPFDGLRALSKRSASKRLVAANGKGRE